MYSELECGICYQTYNAGRRCPRELQCKHSFCENCLLALSRPLQGGSGDDEEARLGADKSIVCPLCRHATSIHGDRRLRVELRVDERVLERLLIAGVLDREDDDDQEEEEEEEGKEGVVQDGCDVTEEGTLPDNPAEEGDSSPGSRGGRLRRSWSKVWRKISGKQSRQNCMTNDDMKHLAMMSSYMF
ncbi:E3 ubiquitin-protein ligase-like [Labrus mixtus]|uniref:E3 ubiquitin-protein ligase-like n=1 Tax=Labrus mixtus TaxID=508554 RepID=UPI0029C0C7BF|nr:E3 ubiquitin-protein ligase-like [Labrus mixtus]